MLLLSLWNGFKFVGLCIECGVVLGGKVRLQYLQHPLSAGAVYACDVQCQKQHNPLSAKCQSHSQQNKSRAWLAVLATVYLVVSCLKVGILFMLSQCCVGTRPNDSTLSHLAVQLCSRGLFSLSMWSGANLTLALRRHFWSRCSIFGPEHTNQRILITAGIVGMWKYLC